MHNTLATQSADQYRMLQQTEKARVAVAGDVVSIFHDVTSRHVTAGFIFLLVNAEARPGLPISTNVFLPSSNEH